MDSSIEVTEVGFDLMTGKDIISDGPGRIVEAMVSPIVSGDELVKQLEEKDAIINDLSSALSHLGARSLELEQSRDRVLTYNCDMTEKLRAFRRCAVAARRFLTARDAFDRAEFPTDAQTLAAAEAECELLDLLTKVSF